MRLYNVKNDYIDYLRKFESKVLFNKNEKRPYVGVVHAIGDTNFYVPLSSPKAKFASMKNAKDFHKIAGGKYGIINFNKMIPII
jgi:protein AbiQ